MWIFVAILIAIVLYLIVLASGKAEKLQEEKYKIDKQIKRLSKNYQEQLKKEEHNNLILLQKNKKLQGFKYQVEDLILGQRTDSEVRAKIKELL